MGGLLVQKGCRKKDFSMMATLNLATKFLYLLNTVIIKRVDIGETEEISEIIMIG